MLTDLSALLDLLKAKGVTHYEGPGIREVREGIDGPWRLISVEFATEAPSLPDDEKSETQDMCRCGHELALHQGGLCMQGCDEEKCS